MKDRSHQRKPALPAAETPLAIPALTSQQKEEARQVRNNIHALAPTAVPFIESLVKDGLIRGWRDVGRFEPFENNKVRT